MAIVDALRRLARHPILCGVLMLFQVPITLSAGISPTDRDAVFQGSVLGCNDQMPDAIRKRAGEAAVFNFCRCYGKEIARTITEEQLNALNDDSVPTNAIPHYGETMRHAWRACEKQLITKDKTASSEPL